MSTVAIIIPFLNRWDLVHARLGELYKYAPDDCEIILVDDASTDRDVVDGIKFWKRGAARHEIHYHRNPENLGFGGSMNNGAKIAIKHELNTLIFHSNDVVISGNYIGHVNLALQVDPTCLIGGQLIWWAAGWNEFVVDEKPLVVPYLNGWLLACSASTWKSLGGFDLRYGKYDYEDVDLSTNAIYLGYNLRALNSKYLAHMGAATISSLDPNRMQHTIDNRKLYEEKWVQKFPELMDRLYREKDGIVYRENTYE